MNANSPQFPLPPQKAQKRSTLGIGSFICTIGSFISVIIPFLLRSLLLKSLPLPSYIHTILTLMSVAAGLALFVALLGIGLGIAAVVQRGTARCSES